jgi:hypothetical protein
MSNSKLIRITDEFDLDRCQGTGTEGQCPYKAVEGGTLCLRHGGSKQIEAQTNKRLRVYHLEKWKERVGEFAGHTEIKSLHEEVGIMRMMLEETLNQCEDSADLLRYASKVTSMVDKISALVTSIDRMDSRQALDPNTLMRLASEWIAIITCYVTDPVKLEELSGRLTNTLDTEAIQIEGPP